MIRSVRHEVLTRLPGQRPPRGSVRAHGRSATRREASRRGRGRGLPRRTVSSLSDRDGRARGEKEDIGPGRRVKARSCACATGLIQCESGTVARIPPITIRLRGCRTAGTRNVIPSVVMTTPNPTWAMSIDIESSRYGWVGTSMFSSSPESLPTRVTDAPESARHHATRSVGPMNGLNGMNGG